MENEGHSSKSNKLQFFVKKDKEYILKTYYQSIYLISNLCNKMIEFGNQELKDLLLSHFSGPMAKYINIICRMFHTFSPVKPKSHNLKLNIGVL